MYDICWSTELSLVAAKVRRTNVSTARSGHGGAQIMRHLISLHCRLPCHFTFFFRKACVVDFTDSTHFVHTSRFSQDILSSPFSFLPTIMAKEFLHQLLKLENCVKSDKPQPCIIVGFPSFMLQLLSQQRLSCKIQSQLTKTQT